MNSNFFEQQSHIVLVCFIAIMSYFLLMFGNGIISLTHPDEVFYIQSAKEMVQHNKWFTPMIFDGVQFEKPFISFALFAAAIKWFGLNSAAARFWPAAFGIMGTLMVYWVSWVLFSKKRIAFLSSVILSTSFIYMALSRAVLTDMIFLVFVGVSIGFFCLAYFREKHKKTGIILMFAVTAIAVLIKGVLGFAFPIGTVLLFLLYKRDLKFLFNKYTLLGFALFLMIALPWHIVMYQNHGQWFIEEYFHNVHMRRLTGSEHPRLNNWYFYFGLMFAGVLPWSFFWISAIKEFFKSKSEHKDKLVLLAAWMVGVLLFIQPAASKLASYPLPLFPAIAILLACTIDSILCRVQRGEPVKLIKFCGYGMVVLLTGVIIGGQIAARMYSDIVTDFTPVYIASFMLLCVTALILLFNLKRQYTRMIISYTGVSITLLTTLFFACPFVEPWVSCKDISEAFVKLDQSDTTVLASKFYVRGIRYYTDRRMAVIDINGKGFWSPHPIPFLNTDQMVIDFLNERPVTWAVVKEGNVKDLKRITQGKPFTIEEIKGISGKYILKIKRAT